jgi:peptidyl-prolyl cis-trans isomerase SurA
MALVLSLAGCPGKERGDDVVARVNGEKILRSEVDKYYTQQTAGSPQPLPQEQSQMMRINILRQLIENELMMQRARKLGLLATDEEVNARIAEIKSPYTEEEFQKKLKDQGGTLDDLKTLWRQNLTIEKVLNKEITSKISITDSDISTYYQEHKAEYNYIEPVYRLSQIVVTTDPAANVGNLRNDKAQNEAEAKKKIQVLMNRLDSGEDFGTVAMNFSEEPNTSQNGGDIGLIPESALKSDPAVMAAVSKLKVGLYTEPIPIYGPSRKLAGYRIIKLFAREPAGQRELGDPRVQAAIRQQLRDRREQLLKAAYYEVVRNDAKVENYMADDLLKNVGVAK